jgi:hypothetical protein
MEAYGFLKAAREEGVPHSMVIRGVSDRIEGKEKSDAAGKQPVAAKNAAMFLFALLRLCPEIAAPKRRKCDCLDLVDRPGKLVGRFRGQEP